MKCEYCGNKHNGEFASGRFCSRKCANSFSSTLKDRELINAKISKSLGGKGKQRKNKCVICNKETKNIKFCTNECRKTFQNNEKEKYINEVEKRNEFFNYNCSNTGALARIPKEYLIKKFGHKCTICGLTKWNKQLIPLILDHINGNANDWKLNNIRLVCPNCDAQLPTYGGRNRGNGTRTYKISYKEKK